MPTAAPDLTLYLLLSILVLLIFLCAGLLATLYIWQMGGGRAATAVATQSAPANPPQIVEVIVIATPTVSPTLALPTAVPTPMRAPMTCADIQRHDAHAPDGEYILYLNRNPAYPATIYCHNMAGTPSEYLSLINTSDTANFASTAYPSDELITHYSKVRLSLHTLTLDPTDRTFATVSGTVPFYSRVPYNDYGRAAGCNEARPGTAVGRANIDLSGTNFALDQAITFTLAGVDVDGSGAQMSQGGQIVTLEAGGRCGWVAPDGPLQLLYYPATD